MLDHVLETTGQSDLTYIGHSLGTTTIMMLLSSKPEYNKKVNLVVHFAPIVYWTTKSPLRIILPAAGEMIQNLLDPRGATEFVPQSSAMIALFKRFCMPNNLLELCYLPLDILLGSADPRQFSKVRRKQSYFFKIEKNARNLLNTFI